jgi:hypothetical protein
MADNEAKTAPQDPSRSNVHEDYEPPLLARSSGITESELRARESVRVRAAASILNH